MAEKKASGHAYFPHLVLPAEGKGHLENALIREFVSNSAANKYNLINIVLTLAIDLFAVSSKGNLAIINGPSLHSPLSQASDVDGAFQAPSAFYLLTLSLAKF